MSATKKAEWDIEDITTRMIAENFGSADLHKKQREKHPGMHLLLASRSGPDKSGVMGGQPTYYKSLGYQILDEDPLITGSPDFILMGVPEEAKEAFRKAKVEANNRDMGGSAPNGMKQLVEMGDSISIKEAAEQAKSSLASGWDGQVTKND